jgi:hypothetical protein
MPDPRPESRSIGADRWQQMAALLVNLEKQGHSTIPAHQTLEFHGVVLPGSDDLTGDQLTKEADPISLRNGRGDRYRRSWAGNARPKKSSIEVTERY